MILELKNVTVSFGGLCALDDLSLAISGGRTIAVIGESGCGKSTLLRLVLGLVRPDRGNLQIGGEDARSGDVLERRRGIGYVIQDGGLFPHLTAAENVALPARQLRWEKGWVRSRIAELAELVHLDRSTLDRFPLQLSGGQRQRVGLMRALMLDPALLLLDEPLGALDPITRSRLQSDLRELFAVLRKTVVLVTHDMAEASFLAERIVLLRQGRIEQEGTARELWEQPASGYVSEFVQAQKAAAWAEAPAA